VEAADRKNKKLRERLEALRGGSVGDGHYETTALPNQTAAAAPAAAAAAAIDSAWATAQAATGNAANRASFDAIVARPSSAARTARAFPAAAPPAAAAAAAASCRREVLAVFDRDTTARDGDMHIAEMAIQLPDRFRDSFTAEQIREVGRCRLNR